jgi:hypothetical protein
MFVKTVEFNFLKTGRRFETTIGLFNPYIKQVIHAVQLRKLILNGLLIKKLFKIHDAN